MPQFLVFSLSRRCALREADPEVAMPEIGASEATVPTPSGYTGNLDEVLLVDAPDDPYWRVRAEFNPALALVTLGAQLANTRLRLMALDIYLASLVRLVAAPLLALLLVKLFGITGVAAQVVVPAAMRSSACRACVSVACASILK